LDSVVGIGDALTARGIRPVFLLLSAPGDAHLTAAQRPISFSRERRGLLGRVVSWCAEPPEAELPDTQGFVNEFLNVCAKNHWQVIL
jgi:hypothetical protein